jgi:glycogen debranching enzyme
LSILCFSRGALEILGALQATQEDNYRDAEPGKMPHEMRYGELAHFKLIPHTPYYGTADATPLYLITLHAAWRATGDRALLEQHLETAEGCLSWIDNYGDRDGDGFQEYQTRSPVGYENMSWKDSGDCVVYPDGSLVKGSKALCELQGYVYNAWVRMAEVFDALGKPDRAQALRAKAGALFDRFNKAFWDEELGFHVCSRWREEESADRRIQCRSLPPVRHRAARARQEGTGCRSCHVCQRLQREEERLKYPS